MEISEQTAKVKELFENSDTLIEVLAIQAGNEEKKGATWVKLIDQLIANMEKLSEGELATYRKGISKACGLSVADLNMKIKDLRANKKVERSKLEPHYTWGEVVDGWLLEYLYDPDTRKAGLAWRDPQGNIDSGDHVIINDTLYEPFPPSDPIIQGVVMMPSKVGEEMSIRELIAMNELWIKTVYILPTPETAKLIAYFILSTWVFDCFMALTYLILMGDTGSGKSELMFRTGILCYHAMSASGGSSVSPFFRMVQKYRGTVMINEGDLSRSGTDQDMIKFYNQGAMKDGNQIWRSEEEMLPNGTKTYVERAFQTYCPKIVTLKKRFYDDAVISRSLVIMLQRREMIELKDAGVPLSMTGDMRKKAVMFRNRMLRFRLKMWQPEIEINPDWYEYSISPRLNQVAGILLALAKDDPEQQEAIRENLRNYYRDSLLTKSMTITARVIEAIWKIWKDRELHNLMVKVDETADPDDQERHLIKIGDITKITNSIMDEMNDDEEEGEEEEEESPKKKRRDKDKVKSRKVGQILRDELQFNITERRRDGFSMKMNIARLKGASMRFGVDPEQIYPEQAAEMTGTPSSPAPTGEGKPEKAEQGGLYDPSC